MKHKFEDIIINVTQKKKPTDEDRQNYIGLEHLKSGNLFVEEYGSERTPDGEKIVMKKGDVLFGKRRAYQKKVAISPCDGIFSAHGMVLRPKEDVICKEFLPFFISSDKFLDEAIRISVGGLSPTINWKDIKVLEFDLPPIDEQKRLAEKLWAAYEVKQSYLKMIAATDEMVKSQFIEMFGNPFFGEAKWPIHKLGECCKINPTRPKGIDDNIVVSFLPMQDVPDDGSEGIYSTRVYSDVKKGFTYCADGDVIFAKITPCMENGKGAELKGLSNAIGMGSTEFHVLRPLDGITNSTWLHQFTRLDLLRKDAAKNMTGTGGQKRVPASYFENFQVGLPPIALQEQFAAIAQQADKSKFELRKSIDAIDKVIKSLINN